MKVPDVSLDRSASIDPEEPLVLDDLTVSTIDQLNIHSKLDRFGWGQDLLGTGLTNWMTKGNRNWWMMNRHGSVIKKGSMIKNNKLMRAGNDQGSHHS